MTIIDNEPELAPPTLAINRAREISAVLLLLGVFGGGYIFASPNTAGIGEAPSRSEDLSTNIVTFVQPGDHKGIDTAVAALKVPIAQRVEIARAVMENQRRIGWIVFTDSIDPDGDAIAVESSGIIQQIVLTNPAHNPNTFGNRRYEEKRLGATSIK